jgi:hypothetical protein
MQPTPMTTTYPTTHGQHTVSTPWQSGWDEDDWWTQHKADVRAAMLGDYPLVIPS